MIEPCGCPTMEHTATPCYALFFGARANYSRMRGIVAALENQKQHALPIYVDTNQHVDPQLIGDGFGPAINSVKVDLGPQHNGLDGIIESSFDYLSAHRSCIAAVVVYGDTHSARGPAEAAHQLGIPIIHVEAGFRTYGATGIRKPSTMPEEVNRIRIDQLASYLLPFTPAAYHQLQSEAVTGTIALPTGHPLADTILLHRQQFDGTTPSIQHGLVTIHRQENLQHGQESGLIRILTALGSTPIDWQLPATPHTLAVLNQTQFCPAPNIHVTRPLQHAEMLQTLADSSVVVTDSAGLSLEAALAGRPLLIPRDIVEFAELCPMLTNIESIAEAACQALKAEAGPTPSTITLRHQYSTGNACRTIAASIAQTVKRLHMVPDMA